MEVCRRAPFDPIRSWTEVSCTKNETFRTAGQEHLLSLHDFLFRRYANHHDYDSEEVDTIAGPRLFTLLFYLNDPINGGETCFPSLETPLCIEPKRGRAVIWPQVLDHEPEAKENRTWHEANSISEGFKYSSTVWYHMRDYSYADKIGCSNLDNLEEEEIYEDDEDDEDDSTGAQDADEGQSLSYE